MSSSETQTLSPAAPQEPALRDYKLSDNLAASSGAVFLTGTQALVRLLLAQKAQDESKGLNTAGFVSGYRGSPLGMVDQQLWKAKKFLDAAKVNFLPAINEDLAATACLGVQRVALDPKRTADGVFAMWYGKGPGVDRSGDALKHGNVYGTSKLGGVLVVCGDDHGCVSSSTPHQSDLALQAWHMPIVHPGNVAEYLEFGLYGWALSRFSSTWVGFKAISEVVESGMTVDLDSVPLDFELPVDHKPPVDLHIRAVDLPSLELETRLEHKLNAVKAFAKLNSIDKHIVVSPRATLGIVTVGKAHYDFMEVLRRLDLDPNALAAAGVRVYKVGLVFPLESSRMSEFAQGLTDMLVIEEKAPVVERQIKELLYHLPDAQRPRVVGKTDEHGQAVLSALGELRPSRIMNTVADWLARLNPALDRRHLVVDFLTPCLLSNAADGVRRQPYFCSGCPHNTSTKLPEGSRALAGIGCHFMASWMERGTSGLIQMGAEGVDWAAHSRFTTEKHVFQNLGDGTYYHSGYLAIRQAIAAKTNITYKILYNDAVAMTGGQPVDGQTSVPQIARQVEAEGVKRLVVVSDEPQKYQGHENLFPPGTSFHDRSELDAVQRELREIEGVTVLIYDQTCAAEKRRRRKKKEFYDPPKRIFINEQVCEGCGDCGQASNCLSVVPVETDFGRKRVIEQSSCNKDFSCVNGFCPSFVSVHGAQLKKRAGAGYTPADLARELAAIGSPKPWNWTGPFDLLVTGVGGTGVVTVGALISMAAHLERKQASVLDFMGFAQKGGSVLSFVRVAPTQDLLNQVRIDTQQADVLLACDMVVGASPDALGTVKPGRTVILANTHELPTAAFVRNPDASLQADSLLAKMQHAVGGDAGLMSTIDAQAIAQELMGDTMPSNIIMLGACWQRGLVPLSEASLMRAMELNGVAVVGNKTAFALGRLAIAAPEALRRLAGRNAQSVVQVLNFDKLDGPDGLLARRSAHLTAYQNSAYAQRYLALVQRVRSAEGQLGEAGKTERLTKAVARYYAKLLAIKDEYEVARLYTDGQFERAMKEQFENWERLSFHLAPPLISKPGADGRAKKIEMGSWTFQAFKLLAKFKGLRGGALDVFGKTEERRMERQLIQDYEALVDELLAGLTADKLEVALQLARLPEQIRGYGHVKHANVVTARAKQKALLDRFHGRVQEAAVAMPVPAARVKGVAEL
ncbi:indolepyruvate ferredoxin oxidoreductase family protein [Paucibacter sp. DJ2R-2]|uniref:indolepyruvate ferredoxin oxidoreductase family protein n=1 Tax=Paucibacter sp. DJ2R-2 TaxID=2893558 RepID=UPI0021E3AC31|nr:indolepyruvate ferredoxin oxidoreductase family protein [Paucibacter sp. DJ2R-2]MCV2420035.1 indolepyruvate ferredoxin oxidoreductase family protein [Paucibacter sp. DJ4R-1]MCV2437038.1 indolepyruvate ferredoxin oxidoreductase family protein [Paucibacter sp. DJ2R-2]